VAGHRRLHEIASSLDDRSPDGVVADTALGPPVPRPRNSFAIGLNYRSHVAEADMEPPEVPLVFTKFPSCIVGPTADVELRSATADYEAELVLVIGDGGRDIAAGDAWEHVAGVTIGQDISDRALQFAAAPPHFDLGKSRDTYGPTGPVLVSPDLLEDRDALPLTCDVNGDRRQDDTTASLIFDVPTLIAYLSSIITLAPGDLVFTGTPDGVGAVKGQFLEPGDVIVTTIAGVGELENRCV
jgi:2-keto-4-pentenoate hydratase/2-oxohepta-3-ene-1,7-dioic acid hydratase in catechol pathway